MSPRASKGAMRPLKSMRPFTVRSKMDLEYEIGDREILKHGLMVRVPDGLASDFKQWVRELGGIAAYHIGADLPAGNPLKMQLWELTHSLEV